MKRLRTALAQELAWAHLLLLVGIGALLWLPTCGLWDLRGPDEGRYVQIAKELLGRSNWFYLTVHGEAYDQKPPLPFWMFAGMLEIFRGRIVPWALRLPSVLFALAAVVSTYLVGRRLFHPRAGLTAGLILIATPLVLSHAAEAKLDMIFTGWIAMAAAAWLTRPRPEGKPLSWGRAALLWGALAGAFFTKGPLALLILLSILAADAWLGRMRWKAVRDSRMIPGLALVFAAIAGWLLIQSRSVGSEFVREQVTGGTIKRLLQGDHSEPPWYYLPRLFFGAGFPWALLLIPLGARLWRERRDLSPGVVSVLGWFLPPFLFLCMATGKRQSYLLPLMPALALLAAYYLDVCVDLSVQLPRLSRAAGAAVLLAGSALILSGIALLVRKDLAWNREFYVQPANLAVLVTSGAALACVALIHAGAKRNGHWLFRTAVAGTILFAGVLQYSVTNPALELKASTRLFAERLSARFPSLGAGEPLGTLEEAERTEYHVYGGYQIDRVDDKELTGGKAPVLPRLLLAEEEEMRKVGPAIVNAGYRRVYYDKTSGDELLLFSRDAKPAGKRRAAKTLHFALAGDTGTGDEHAARVGARMAELDRRQPLDAVFLMGDNMYHEGRFDEALEDRFLGPFGGLVEAEVPFYAALGNHEYMAGLADETREYPLWNMKGRNYYSVDFGDNEVTFFILDSETIANDPAQVHWLRNKVEGCASRWKVVLLHTPFEGTHGGHKPSAGIRNILKGAITEGDGVDLVVSGHNHFYERSRLKDGIEYITAGSGGELRRDPLPDNPERAVGYIQERAFLTIEFRDGALHGLALNEYGETVDAFTLTKPGGELVLESPSLLPGTPAPPSTDKRGRNRLAPPPSS
ncbi:glycosyltransferase family 39 protein [Candidatus Poribacteria bacterium]|nr:glycosyltransferase family 39 protein [Candidatus Poribacteria bacterium]